ncbi:MAG: UDP-N-acetylmuramoyl-L-alanine--D-glutamate ligase [Phascolarctobacterium sp.]|nr:UDP-N-acetylmuramoyl-L-alanine--D-glutamate ligase [Phascolarctobacterium sp.]
MVDMMNKIAKIFEQAVIVYGAGISGRGAAEVLARRGEQVYLYNDNAVELPAALAEMLSATGGALVIGSAAFAELLDKAGMVVLSPGVPCDNPNILLAEKRGLEVISEVELGYRLYGGHIAAITGTNGKTTTTSIVGEMLKRLPVPSAVGGNIGLALSKEVESLPDNAWLAAELSSFQLEKVTSFCPDIAVVLNLTPDHLERHHTMEAYGAAKQNIFRQQGPNEVTVLNYDDPEVRTWARYSQGKICYFSRKTVLDAGIFMQNGDFVIKWKNTNSVVCNIDELHLFGGHNEENVLAAIACGFFAGVPVSEMADVLRHFRSIEHRLEYVEMIKGVPYYNDSKATNTDSTIKALEAFPKGHIILLAGGHDKLTELEPMMALVKEKCDALILLGEAKERFYKAAVAQGVEHIELAASFEDAVNKAYKLAQEPQVVLLSPACSSYDMFKNYPERGRCFKKLVQALPR